MKTTGTPDLICLSHLRWDFVYQRPQHLMTRFARERRVFYFEEPLFDESAEPTIELSHRDRGLRVAVPHIPRDTPREQVEDLLEALLDQMVLEHRIERFGLWYYTPMALGFSAHLEPEFIVFDCMDELSAFRNAPQELIERESRLIERADLVFTGGQSLYEAKKDRHPRAYAFPSSIDREHFAKARIAEEPEDQRDIPHPRIGFFGVLDERLDRELLAGLAAARPDWHFMLIGPVVKIDPGDLPTAGNIHYLGGRSYADLPAYLSGWDVATLLFARNESTRFISPTKTPEYLAAGLPVVSTSIRDVVRPYGEQRLVLIADEVNEFAAAIEHLLDSGPGDGWEGRVDAMLAKTSWDQTWASMRGLLEGLKNGRIGGVRSATSAERTGAN